jgi:hypothetical protein
MLSAATDIPVAPAPFTAGGADPISMKIMSTLPSLEAPIQTGLPEVKAEATKTATSIVEAAAKYLQTDEQLARAYEGQFDGQGGTPGGGGGGGGAPGAGVSEAGAVGAGAQSPAAAGGAGGMDQIGQLMSMPMQMAGQAAQIPMQAMGALSSIPQGIMQGVQQVSKLAGGMGGGESASLGQDELNKPDESLTHPKEEPSKSSSTQDGAGPARPHEERAPVEQGRPETTPREESPAHAEEKKPAQTRPAEVAQQMNL